jgi:hypothetical protein
MIQQLRFFDRPLERSSFSSMSRLLGVALLATSIGLAGCGGVPLRSLPRLIQLQNDFLGLQPSEFTVALQVDARLAPPAGAVPLLVVKLMPKNPELVETVDKKLPLQVAVTSVATLGLEAPPPGRRWLIYTLPPATQTELRRIQGILLKAKAMPDGKGSGSLSVGVEQDSLAVTDPALANTRWDTWLQTKQREGFFEVWTGTPAQLQKMAAEKR